MLHTCETCFNQYETCTEHVQDLYHTFKHIQHVRNMWEYRHINLQELPETHTITDFE